MENIISTAVSWGGPGGGTHSHYLELYSMGDRYELSVLQDYIGDGGGMCRVVTPSQKKTFSCCNFYS